MQRAGFFPFLPLGTYACGSAFRPQGCASRGACALFLNTEASGIFSFIRFWNVRDVHYFLSLTEGKETDLRSMDIALFAQGLRVRGQGLARLATRDHLPHKAPMRGPSLRALWVCASPHPLAPLAAGSMDTPPLPRNSVPVFATDVSSGCHDASGEFVVPHTDSPRTGEGFLFSS